jgi:hypothetical protein
VSLARVIAYMTYVDPLYLFKSRRLTTWHQRKGQTEVAGHSQINVGDKGTKIVGIAVSVVILTVMLTMVQSTIGYAVTGSDAKVTGPGNKMTSVIDLAGFSPSVRESTRRCSLIQIENKFFGRFFREVRKVNGYMACMSEDNAEQYEKPQKDVVVSRQSTGQLDSVEIRLYNGTHTQMARFTMNPVKELGGSGPDARVEVIVDESFQEEVMKDWQRTDYGAMIPDSGNRVPDTPMERYLWGLGQDMATRASHRVIRTDRDDLETIDLGTYRDNFLGGVIVTALAAFCGFANLVMGGAGFLGAGSRHVAQLLEAALLSSVRGGCSLPLTSLDELRVRPANGFKSVAVAEGAIIRSAHAFLQTTSGVFGGVTVEEADAEYNNGVFGDRTVPAHFEGVIISGVSEDERGRRCLQEQGQFER